MKAYTVTVNFAGFYGCDQEYTVYADNVDEAYDEALQAAIDDLSIDITSDTDEED